MALVRRAFGILAALVLVMANMPAPASASTVRLTMYADGKSCPGNCDAHVVFDPAMNGTEFAHLQGSTTKPFKPCTTGGDCEICLESGLRQCLVVMYRGAGPTHGTFDMTPAFYESRCASSDLPAVLKAKCAELQKAAAALEGRINCFKDAGNAACKVMIDAARETQRADVAVYEKCIAQGQANFNKGKPAEQQRSNACAYELKGTGGPNSNGTRWRKLLPGACREGTLVGRDGLDCCSGSLLADGPLGRECRAFYPTKS